MTLCYFWPNFDNYLLKAALCGKIRHMSQTHRDLRIRVPVDLHERLKLAATAERRSLNGLVIHLLREQIEPMPRHLIYREEINR